MAATERDFYNFVEKVAAEHGLNDAQMNMVEMYCAENGSDCGENAYQVAIDTLKMLIDQVTLKSADVLGMYK